NTESLPQYEIAGLPEGYVEIERKTAPGLVVVIYKNDQKEVIYFNYVFMHQGTLSGFETRDADVFEMQVNSHQGAYFEVRTPGGLNTLTWIDEDQNLQFAIDGCYQYDDLLRMAESISLCNPPN
ncbi:MAG: DUF4367 domain-containing protein, partial [Oscillospiraceae bacterium]|nr:DUF4367 domain-containing protein [Oscillospiraceae bacterium]